MRAEKLKGPGIWSKAARHNKRAIQAELGAAGHIDATRSHLNITLLGPTTPEGVAALAKAKTTDAGITKDRKNGVAGLELVFSLPPGHRVDVMAYFTACAQWAGTAFGGHDNIISVDIHRDESQDHAHVLLLPLLDGRLRGSDAIGNKRQLAELQSRFYKDVASGFGFSKPRTKPMGNHRADLTRRVLELLRLDPAAKSGAWAAIWDSVSRDPTPYALALGINPATIGKAGRTMAQIFTSRGKGGRVQNPIGNLSTKPYMELDAKKTQTLGLCREFVFPPLSEAPTAAQFLSNYARLTKPTDGRGWLPAGLVDHEAVPEAVTRKAAKHLAKLPRGGHDAIVIQAGRTAGLSIDQLSAWAGLQTVAQALASGSRPWRDLWTHTSLEVWT